MMRKSFLALAWTGLVRMLGVLCAQLPQARLNTIFPAGGKVGGDVEITATGADLDEAAGLRFSHPGIVAKLKTAEPAVFTVTIGKDVPVGVYEARVIGRFGVRNPRAFAVGDRPEMNAKGGNTAVASAIEVALGTVVNGAVEANAESHFKIAMKAGQRTLIRCSGREIDSKLEPVMVLSDAAGKELEHSRRTGLIDFTAAADGAFILKIHDAVYRGGADFFYRLSVGTGPHIDFVMPPCGVSGTRAMFVVYGRNLPGGTSANLKAADGKPLEQLAVQMDIPSDSVSLQRLSTSTLVGAGDSALDGFEYRVAGAEGASNPVL